MNDNALLWQGETDELLDGEDFCLNQRYGAGQDGSDTKPPEPGKSLDSSTEKDSLKVKTTHDDAEALLPSHNTSEIPPCVVYSTISSESSCTLSLVDKPSTDRNVSWKLTMLSILGMLQGATFLAIPFVVSRGGIVVLLSTIWVGGMTCYTCIALIDCQYQESKTRPGAWKRVHTTYIAVGTAALPKRIGGTVMTLVTLSSLLTDVYIFILMGQAAKELIRDFLQLNNIDYACIWAALLLPCLFITRASILAWFMAASLFLFTGVTVMIYIYLFLNISDFNIIRLNEPFSLKYLLIGYGAVLNSFNFHWVVPAVEGSMKSPEKAKSAFVTSNVLSIVIKLSLAFLSVSILGAKVQQSITSNLFTNYYVSLCTNAILLLCAYLYLPMGMFVVNEMMDLYVLPHFPLFTNSGIRFRIWQLLSRLLIVLSVLFLAVSIPQFGLVISAVGNVRGTIVALVLPLYCHLKLKWKTINLRTKVLEIGVIVITSFMSVGGTYYAVKEIIHGL